MAGLEQVEKLRQKANVSYAVAREALEACDGDILDALIYLERKGYVDPPAGGGHYSSERTAIVLSPIEENHGDSSQKRESASFTDLLKRFGRFCQKLLHIGNTNSFEVRQGETVRATIPVTVLVMLVLFAFWITLPLLVIGLFFHFNYHFVGPELGKQPVNNVMDDAAKAAENLKNSVRNETK